MKKFQFRLEKVLRVKELEEKIKMKEVAVINRRIQTLTKELEEKNILFERNINKISDQRQGTTNSVELKQSLAYREILLKESSTILNNREFSFHDLDKKRLELSKIYRDKKVIQKLKELKLEEFNKELLAREQDELNDLSQRKSRIVFPPNNKIEERIARA